MEIKHTVLFLIALGVAGCGSSHSLIKLGSADSTQVFPLKVGNTFISKKEYFDLQTGKQYLTKIDTVKILGTQVLGDETFYVTNTNQYLVNRSDGYWLSNGAVTKTGPALEAKYPGSVGETFPSYTKITNENPPDTVIGTWEILAKDEKVTVPAGTFTCMKYRREARGITTQRLHLQNLSWWSPGFGLIKREDYYPSEKGSLILICREELLSEELK